MIVQRTESEQELNHKIEKIQVERTSLQERVQALQRALATLETEKREQEREQVRLEKDKAALQKTLDKVGIGVCDFKPIYWSSIASKAKAFKSVAWVEPVLGVIRVFNSTHSHW